MRTKGKTGEKIEISGVYKNEYGKEITLIKDNEFPSCPHKNKPTTWELQ